MTKALSTQNTSTFQRRLTGQIMTPISINNIVIAPPFSGKTTAARQFGWFDIDCLDDADPTLKTCSWPEWITAVQRCFRFEKPIAAMVRLNVLTSVHILDAMTIGAPWTHTVLVIIPEHQHRHQADMRHADRVQLYQVLRDRDLLMAFARRYHIPCASSFTQAQSLCLQQRAAEPKSGSAAP